MGEDPVPSPPWYDETSYMVLPGDFPNDAALFSYVAHELNHASQLVLAALTSTPSNFDPDTQPFAAAAVGATLAVETSDAGSTATDAGTDADAGSGIPPAPVGCGCAGAEGAWLALALLLVRRRALVGAP